MKQSLREKAIVQVKNVTMAYQEENVLENINLEIPFHSRTAIIGPNGAGKSTLLKGMLGLQKMLTGEILLFAQPFAENRKRIAYVAQRSEVNWQFPITVFDVVLMGRYVHLGWLKKPGKADKEKALQALEKMGMAEYAKRQIAELSGGQKQRVFIARAIVQEAELFILDEPFAGVDKKTESVIVQFLKEAQAQGRTSIVVHHDLTTLREYYDHLIILNRLLIAAGDMEHTFTRQNLQRAAMIREDLYV